MNAFWLAAERSAILEYVPRRLKPPEKRLWHSENVKIYKYIYMIIMGQWTQVENNNEVLLRVTNHTRQTEKNLLGPAGIRTHDIRVIIILIIILHPSSLFP